MRLRIITGFIFLCIVCSHLYSQSVEFYKEDLKFSIENNWFKVKGIYYFRNLTHDTIRKFLIYPFPDEKEFGKIDSIKVTALENRNETTGLKGINAKGAVFTIFVLPKGTAAYEIEYRQQIQSKKMKYILTSMRTWRNKLEVADFELSFPADLCIGSINFIPDKAMLRDGKTVWQWSKRNFMPDRDIDIFLRE